MSLVIPIVAAVGSAAVSGSSTSLEHREAGQAPAGSIVFALPVRVAMEHSLPSWKQLTSAAMTIAGLALFLLIVAPTSATHVPSGHNAGALIGAGVAVAALPARRGLRESGHRREVRLAVLMPIVSILGPLIGIAFAGLVFGEIPHHSPLHIVLDLFGLAGIAYGLHGLAGTEITPVTETIGRLESVGAR